ncbi:MOSC domain-containing protein [Nonomuraea sp. NPDC050153]|uniref:MOSC domain-containing protein n=1 Tax=Nonomuraea sp. NPDC050153 TaxID=3364359 RepID=UPI0037AECDC7
MSVTRQLHSCPCQNLPGRAESPPLPVGQVVELARYPVKSLGGERLTRARFTADGVAGDRSWAVYTADGGIGSGKTTRRFRRIDGLLDLRARLDGPPAAAPGDADVPLLILPDGREHRADDPAAGQALSTLLDRPLRLNRQSSVPHHDEAPVHLVTTAAVRKLEQLLGEPVDVARFRANLVLDVDGAGFVEDDWQGRHLTIGHQVELCLGPGMPRCVMVGMPQPHVGLGPDARLLKLLGHAHQVRFGLQAGVVRGGTVQQGDLAALR